MKVLILGAGGLTGRYLVREAKRRGMEVAPFTRQELDITQPDVARETLAKVRPDVVINAASVTSLETCEENPALSRKVNCEAPEEWAKECGRAGVRFVHLGTDYIFDGKKTSAYLPTDPASPLSRYGRDKAEGEKKVLRANPHALIVRLAWVYGHGKDVHEQAAGDSCGEGGGGTGGGSDGVVHVCRRSRANHSGSGREKGGGDLPWGSGRHHHMEIICGQGLAYNENKKWEGGLSGDPGVGAGQNCRIESATAGAFPVGHRGDGENFGTKNSKMGGGVGGVFKGDWVVNFPLTARRDVGPYQVSDSS